MWESMDDRIQSEDYPFLVDEVNFSSEKYMPDQRELQDIADLVKTILDVLIERVIPEPERILSFAKASQCLSLLGKIWNLTENHEGCEIDSIKCQTSDQRLLDMEGYVEEYQYLKFEAVDMGLTDIQIIPEHFIWLLTVDLSGNRLTNISALPLTKLMNLVSLKLNRNQIVDPCLNPMKHLQYLGMNSNKIESLRRIYHPNLITLDLKWNLIEEINGVDCWKLQKLRQLDLRGNLLKSTAGIEYQNLRELYLAENKINKLDGMKFLPNLKTLHLRSNPLSSLAGFHQINSSLQYLNIRSCMINTYEELNNLKVLEALTVLIVTDNLFNPASQKNLGDDPVMRSAILTILPHLKRLNKHPVTKDDVMTVTESVQETEEAQSTVRMSL